MMFFKEVLAAMEEIASLKLAADWDNCGIQIDVGKDRIEKVFVALEITNEIIREARENEADMIITHHPLIFSPLNKIDRNTLTGNYIVELFNSSISVCSAHTNFDEVGGGNNDYIASLLELEDVEKRPGNSLIYTGKLPEIMDFWEVCDFVKSALNLEIKFMNATGSPMTKINKIGICAGSGSSMIDEAIEACCDLYITGDVRYHDARYAAEKGICLLDAWHYGMERFFPKNYSEKLLTVTEGRIEIITSQLNLDPFYNC